MENRQVQNFDTGQGKLTAILVTETDPKLKDIRQQYVEVYPAGKSNPEEMIAWFGSLESFTRWIGGGEVRNY